MNRRRARAVNCLAGGLVLLLAGGAFAADPATQPTATNPADWPQWRGPTRDGIAADGPKLLDTWPKEGPKLLWKSGPIPAGPAGGSGSVVVADGKAFVYVNAIRAKSPTGKPTLTAQALEELGKGPDALPAAALAKLAAIKDKEFRSIEQAYYEGKYEPTAPGEYLSGEFLACYEVYTTLGRMQIARVDRVYNAIWNYYDMIVCLDAATGQEIWRKEFEVPPPVGGWPASSTPAVAGGKVYAVGVAALYCLSVKDGAVIWQVPWKNRSEMSSSPLVANGAVYVAEPDLTARDAETGQLLWKTPVGGTGYGGPKFSVVPWTSGGKSYLLGLSDGSFYCVEPDTGKVLWKAVGTGAGEGSTSVAISGDTAAFFGNGGVYAFKLTPEKAEQLWKTPPGTWRAATLIIFQDCVYVGGTSPMRCMDLKTGQVKWERKEIANHYASPVLADGKVIYPTGHGWFPLFVVMFRATPEKYEGLGLFPQPQENGHGIVATCSSPAIANGKLYLRLSGKDHCIACYDVAEHRPYVEEIAAKGNKLVCAIAQADGGLKTEAPDGAIQGLLVTDALGAAKPAQARLSENALIVDVKDALFPVVISYESGNLSAKNGPLAPFQWRSPRLLFKRCYGNTLTLDFRGDQGPDPKIWGNVKAYDLAEAKVTGVDVSRWTVRLTTDKEWKLPDKITLRYPAMPGESALPKVELSGVVPLARAVGDKPLQEFLFGESRKGVEAKDIEKALLAEDDQDRNIRPQADDKWKIRRILPEEEQFSLCTYYGSNVSKTFIPACVYVYADQDRKVQLWTKGNGGMQIAVNGKVVSTDGGEHTDYNKIKDVELKKGWNTVLLTLAPIKDWVANFSLRIRDEQGNVPTGLWYTAERPVEK